jgi:hypothetical protein
VYFSAGVAGLAAFGAGQALPNEGPLWLVARLLFDGAGGLFGLYLLAGLGLSVVGYVARAGQDEDPAGRRPWP